VLATFLGYEQRPDVFIARGNEPSAGKRLLIGFAHEHDRGFNGVLAGTVKRLPAVAEIWW
jgi:hypothetical protein